MEIRSSPTTGSYRGSVNPVGPRSCYDEGKRIAEALTFDYRNIHNLDAKILRIFNTYGPRMHPEDGRVISNFIVQALKVRTFQYMVMVLKQEVLFCG